MSLDVKIETYCLLFFFVLFSKLRRFCQVCESLKTFEFFRKMWYADDEGNITRLGRELDTDDRKVVGSRLTERVIGNRQEKHPNEKHHNISTV